MKRFTATLLIGLWAIIGCTSVKTINSFEKLPRTLKVTSGGARHRIELKWVDGDTARNSSRPLDVYLPGMDTGAYIMAVDGETNEYTPAWHAPVSSALKAELTNKRYPASPVITGPAASRAAFSTNP